MPSSIPSMKNTSRSHSRLRSHLSAPIMALDARCVLAHIAKLHCHLRCGMVEITTSESERLAITCRAGPTRGASTMLAAGICLLSYALFGLTLYQWLSCW